MTKSFKNKRNRLYKFWKILFGLRHSTKNNQVSSQQATAKNYKSNIAIQCVETRGVPKY